jgi:hypothetical protein
MEHGNPWSRTMPSKKALATDATLYGWPSVMKFVNFENLSTTVRTTDLPPTFENPSMKSIDISLHTWDGTGSGTPHSPEHAVTPAGCRKIPTSASLSSKHLHGQSAHERVAQAIVYRVLE